MNLKNKVSDLAIFGGKPSFDEKLFVGRPNIGNRERLSECINDILDHRWLTNDGPYVQELEKKLADFLHVKHCIAVCNATIGLEIAIRALDMSGEVIVPSMTFIATAHALDWQKITPVFCDIDSDTWDIDPKKIEDLITPKTTGIIGVHLFGRPCEVDALSKIASKHNLKLLYDAAHALGNSLGHKMIGNFGDAEVFSFHATKFFNSLEGGAITTNSDELADKLRLMRNFGFQNYKVVSSGTNGKMNEFSAAMGLTSFECMPDIVETNMRNYEKYREQIAGLPGVELIEYNTEERCNFQYVVLDIDSNVMARDYFSPGCHKAEPYASDSKYKNINLPVTEQVSDRLLSLPTGTSVGEAEIISIAGLLKYCVDNGGEISSGLATFK
jgi:dTDP-4-amino-4,6-dideoxygalactose transaminase